MDEKRDARKVVLLGEMRAVPLDETRDAQKAAQSVAP